MIGLSNDVWQQLAFQLRNLILDLQLLLFEALELQQIRHGALRERADRVVKIAVFALKLLQPSAQLILIFHEHPFHLRHLARETRSPVIS
jgi:hypothetical protein